MGIPVGGRAAGGLAAHGGRHSSRPPISSWVNNDLIIQRLGFGFAPLIMLSLVSVISNMLCTMSTLTESWHPRMRTNVRRPSDVPLPRQ